MASAVMRIDAEILHSFLLLPEDCKIVAPETINILVEHESIPEGTREVKGVYERGDAGVRFRRFLLGR